MPVHAHACRFCGNQKHQNRFHRASPPCTLTFWLYWFIHSSFVLTALSLNFSRMRDRSMGVKGCFLCMSTYMVMRILSVFPHSFNSVSSSFPLFTVPPFLFLPLTLFSFLPVFTVVMKMTMTWRFTITTMMVLTPRRENVTLARHAGPVRRFVFSYKNKNIILFILTHSL